MASPPEGRAAVVELEERLLTVAAVDTNGEPQSVTRGGPDEGCMHSRRALLNGVHTGALDSSEPSRSADGGRSKQRPPQPPYAHLLYNWCSSGRKAHD